MWVVWCRLLTDNHTFLNISMSLTLKLEAAQQSWLSRLVIYFVGGWFWELLLLLCYLNVSGQKVSWSFLIDHILLDVQWIFRNGVVARSGNALLGLQVRVHVVSWFDIFVEASNTRLINVMVPKFELVVRAKVGILLSSIDVTYHIFNWHQIVPR